MVQDVRSSAVGNAAPFDLLSEAGVLAVLQAIRQSSLPSGKKSELRDLVFLYRNGGGSDSALRSELENELKAASLTVTSAAVQSATSPSVSQAPVPRSGFASGRPAPVFIKPKVPTSPAAPVVSPLPTPAPKSEIKEAAIPAVVPKIVLPKMPAADPVKENVVPTNLPVEPVKVPVDVNPVPSVVIPDSEPLIPPVSPVVNNSSPINDTSDLEAARARISTIKQDVNAKVGNAVNLMDRDNNVGREYMSALLEAMKAANNGADLSTHMLRLEAAYKAVGDLVSGNSSPAPQPSVVEQVVVPPIVPMVPASTDVPPPTPVPAPTPKLQVETTPTNKSWDLPVEQPIEPQISVALVASDMPSVAIPPVPVRPAGIPMTPVSTPSSVLPVAPVATAAPLKTPQDLPTAADVKARSGITDPLHSPEVDAGLEQLLSEWSLFRKSGIFGTGPHGREHPLFIKMAPLSLSMILSGRFEGSTQEIRQSVTDYMNGWRYEQGVVYENDENFEHYLRRVIRHIIDLQTAKRK